MINNQAKILEAVDDIFDAGISAGELFRRKNTIARVLKQADKALKKAEETGQIDIANKLKDKIDILSELLERADDFDAADEIDDLDAPSVGKEESDEEIETDGSSADNDEESEEEPEAEEGSETDNTDSNDDAESDVSDVDTDISDSIDDQDDQSDEESSTSRDNTKEAPTEPGGSPAPVKPDDEDNSDEDDSEEDDSSSDKSTSDNIDDSDDIDSKAESEDEGKESTEDGDAEKEIPDDDKILIDPFARRPDDGDELDPGDREIETLFDSAKRILGKLSGESKRGAISGLRDLLKNRGVTFDESLHATSSTSLYEKLTKPLARMSEDEFNAEITSTLDIIDKILKIEYSDDLDKRVAEIKRDSMSRTARAELEKEDAAHVNADKKAIKALDRENTKYSKIGGLRGLEAFGATLYKAVADQVAEAEDDAESWAALDRRHEDDPTIIKKGHILDDGEKEIPTVHVYFDQSGSWTSRDVELGMKAISSINEFHQNGQIKLSIFYMAGSSVFTDANEARSNYWAEGWNAALSHIKGSKVKNVVILADDDIDNPYLDKYNRPTGTNGRTIVDGCVWWLWKNGKTAPKAMSELVGRRGNYQYQFKA